MKSKLIGMEFNEKLKCLKMISTPNLWEHSDHTNKVKSTCVKAVSIICLEYPLEHCCVCIEKETVKQEVLRRGFILLSTLSKKMLRR